MKKEEKRKKKGFFSHAVFKKGVGWEIDGVKRVRERLGYYYCSRGAKTLNIKACFGLEIGKRNEQGGEAARTYSQWSLLRRFAKERKKTCPG